MCKSRSIGRSRHGGEEADPAEWKMDGGDRDGEGNNITAPSTKITYRSAPIDSIQKYISTPFFISTTIFTHIFPSPNIRPKFTHSIQFIQFTDFITAALLYFSRISKSTNSSTDSSSKFHQFFPHAQKSVKCKRHNEEFGRPHSSMISAKSAQKF
jgi:hypothetical protein